MFDGQSDLPRFSRSAPSELALQSLLCEGAIIIEDAAAGTTFDAAVAELSPWFEAAPTGTGPFFGTTTRRFSGVFAKAPSTAHLACDEYILSIIEGALGPHCDAIQLNLTQAIGIEPGARAQVLHRDEVMFPFPHDFEVMVNVMWTLDAWSAENGATRVAPRSQAWPRTRLAEPHEVLTASAPKGAALLWLGSIIHGGGANRSDALRRGLAFSYSLGWLGQSERLLLSTPPDVARALPTRLQRLIGYQIHRPNLGWVEERDPLDWLHGRTQALAPADDNLTPAQEALVRWRLEAEEHA